MKFLHISFLFSVIEASYVWNELSSKESFLQRRTPTKRPRGHSPPSSSGSGSYGFNAMLQKKGQHSSEVTSNPSPAPGGSIGQPPRKLAKSLSMGSERSAFRPFGSSVRASVPSSPRLQKASSGLQGFPSKSPATPGFDNPYPAHSLSKLRKSVSMGTERPAFNPFGSSAPASVPSKPGLQQATSGIQPFPYSKLPSKPRFENPFSGAGKADALQSPRKKVSFAMDAPQNMNPSSDSSASKRFGLRRTFSMPETSDQGASIPHETLKDMKKIRAGDLKYNHQQRARRRNYRQTGSRRGFKEKAVDAVRWGSVSSTEEWYQKHGKPSPSNTSKGASSSSTKQLDKGAQQEPDAAEYVEISTGQSNKRAKLSASESPGAADVGGREKSSSPDPSISV